MSESEIYKQILFSLPFEEGDESCYLKGSFNCNGDGSVELLKTDDGKNWEVTLKLLPGTYNFFYSVNQYNLFNEHRERIKKPMTLHIKQEYFFHDPDSSRFFSRNGGFFVIRCITPPDVKNVRIEQAGSRKKKNDFKFRSRDYNLFEFISRTDGKYIFYDDHGNRYGPFTPPARDEAKKSSNIIYQIFPDRFNRKGSPDAEFTKWGEPPERNSFFGGNVEGIIEKIPYLADLGVDHLYLTPFYSSRSNHRYDIDDYFSVDRRFGTLDQLTTLSKKLQEDKISMILDMVFNHTSIYFPQFVKELREKLPHDQSWYKFIRDTNEGMRIRWPVKDGKTDAFYESFLDNGGMPKLNHRNESVKKFMLDVMNFYAERLNVSFLRYDVADSINLNSMSEIFGKFREKFPAIGHIAEVWCVSDIFFHEGLYTSSMNYGLRKLIISLMNKEISPNRMNSELLNMRFILGDDVYGKMMNIIDSHDTPRIRTILGSEKLAMAAYGIIMIMDGMPSIYYGDELSMEGGPDPDCRRTMEWEKVGSEFYLKFRELVKIRKENPAAYNGIIRFSRDKKGLINITKYSIDQKIEMNLNLGDSEIKTEEKKSLNSIDEKSTSISPEEFSIHFY